MVTALKEFTLHGSRYAHGSPIPDAKWGLCGKRTQTVLERNRFVTFKPLRSTPKPVVHELTCWCGYEAQSKQALGGHRRGHTTRGETPKEG